MIAYPETKTFEVQNDPIEYTRAMIPAMSWRYVDKKGHEHRWTKDEKTPSLRWRRTGWNYYCDGAKLPIGHYECRKCGEEIDRPWISNSLSEYLPGPTRYYIDGVRVDKETFEKEYQPYKLREAAL